jgi:hypothetical protein
VRPPALRKKRSLRFAEVGFNYSYTRVNPGGAVPPTNANAGYGYAEYSFNRVFGLVAELGEFPVNVRDAA